MRSAASLLLLLATPAAAQQPAPPTPYQRAIAAGYKALTLCSAMFNAGRSRAQVEGVELKGIYPEYDAIVPTLGAAIDRASGTVLVDGGSPSLPPRTAIWRKGKGCTTLPIGAGGAQTGDAVTPVARADPRPWPVGDAGIAAASLPLARIVDKAFDRTTYGAGETVGVVIVRENRIAAERYSDGFGPFVANRTWSVGKSIAGTLAGLAQLDPKAPAAIVNWRQPGDPRARITNDHLLRMASGLHSDTAGNRTDAIYFGGTAVDEQAPGWPLETAPNSRFRYANNDILLAMMSLRARGSAKPGTATFPSMRCSRHWA